MKPTMNVKLKRWTECELSEILRDLKIELLSPSSLYYLLDSMHIHHCPVCFEEVEQGKLTVYSKPFPKLIASTESEIRRLLAEGYGLVKGFKCPKCVVDLDNIDASETYNFLSPKDKRRLATIIKI